jgi:4-hydroxy-tetrahydrodipicolinate reductase
MNETKIGIVGAAGRMGQMLVRQLVVAGGCRLTTAGEAPGSALLGRDAGIVAGASELGVRVTDDTEAVFRGADVVIDFTIPAASARHSDIAARQRTALVIGTTGLDAGQAAQVKAAATHVPIVWAPNMSVGVTLLMNMVERVAKVLKDDYDIEIIEMHHRMKIDAPSGTALGLGRAAARGRGVDFDSVARRARDGHTGERRRGDIGFAVARGGDVVGEHVVIFAGDGERIELGHRAAGRQIFAQGAIRAAQWCKGRAPGLYAMSDVLDLN